MNYILVVLSMAVIYLMNISPVKFNNDESNQKLDSTTVEGLWIFHFLTKPKRGNIDNLSDYFFVATSNPDTVDIKKIVSNPKAFRVTQNSWYLDWPLSSDYFFYYYPSYNRNEKWEYKMPTYYCQTYRFRKEFIKTALVKYKAYLLKVPTKELYGKQLLLNRTINPNIDSTNLYLFYRVLEQNCYKVEN